jgi:integrase
MPKLTKRIVDAAEAQAAEYFVWDSDIPGSGLRVLPSGRKGYVVQYRAGRRSRRISLGPTTVLTCEQARTRAITIVAAARNGQDPAAERDAGRKAITIKELAERFDKEHIAIRVKVSTGKEYRRNLQRFILPALGQLTVTGITRADVAKFHHDLRHIPYQANRCLEVISKMFSLSEMWGLRPDGTNPRKHIRKYPEEKRERFLSAAELRRIGEVLREMEAEGVELPSAILAARLLILTGCRLNEIMSLKWSYLQLAETILGEDEHRRVGGRGESGLADAGDAVDQHARRAQSRRGLKGCERDGHQRASSPSSSRNFGLPVRTVRAGSNSWRMSLGQAVYLRSGTLNAMSTYSAGSAPSARMRSTRLASIV